MINYTAFDRKYTLIELHDYVKNKSGGIIQQHKSSAIVKFFIIFMGFIYLIFLLSLVITIFEILSGHGDMLDVVEALSIQVMFLIVPPAVYLSYLTFSVKRKLLLEQFCKDNGFTFSPNLSLGKQSGVIFTKGHSKKAKNGIVGYAFGGFILFDYQYTTGSGKNSKTYNFGVTRISLDKKFPHILLDNKRDGSVGSFEFAGSQKLELEGNFNKYFNVFGPKEYEIEVLQVLNPVVMQALLAAPEPVDIEIIGHDLYIYNKGNHYKKETVQSLFIAIEQLYTSTASVRKSFSMPEQIGDYKPVLKRSKWPIIATASITFAVVLVYFLASVFVNYVKHKANSLP